MNLIVKSVLGVFSLVGSCCAIGVPLAMNLSGGISRGNVASQVGVDLNSGQGGGQLTTELDLDKCNSEGGRSTVPFGSPKGGSYCWKVQIPQQIESSNLTESLNTLFKRMWESGDRNWNSNSNSSWSANCLKQGGNQWVLVGGTNTTEHLGHCVQGTKSIEETSFLEINKTEPTKLDIKLCWHDCWAEGFREISIQKLENKKENNWRLVEFYKK